MAVSKLPKPLRLQQAALIEGAPLDELSRMSREATITTVGDVGRLAGIDAGSTPGKAKLRETAQLLAAFGLGVTFDPAYASRTPGADDPVLLFPLDQDPSAEPTERFRPVQLSVMLGLVVGHADGQFDESERSALIQRIDREPTLKVDERTRLRAELRLNEAYPDRLDDWMKRLKDVSADSRMAVADELIAVASADGNLHAAEVRKLEVIFKRMGLGNQVLYDRLHSAPGSRGTGAHATPADLSGVKPSTRIDLSKLHSIRSETSVTANVLADIFADEDAGAAEPILVDIVQAVVEVETFEGLEQRYGALLNELRLRASWSSSDFDHLARDAGLMPGAAREAINDWAMDRFDELLLEGDDPIEISLHLLPAPETEFSDDKMDAKSA